MSDFEGGSGAWFCGSAGLPLAIIEPRVAAGAAMEPAGAAFCRQAGGARQPEQRAVVSINHGGDATARIMSGIPSLSISVGYAGRVR